MVFGSCLIKLYKAKSEKNWKHKSVINTIAALISHLTDWLITISLTVEDILEKYFWYHFWMRRRNDLFQNEEMQLKKTWFQPPASLILDGEDV